MSNATELSEQIIDLVKSHNLQYADVFGALKTATFFIETEYNRQITEAIARAALAELELDADGNAK